MYILNEVGGEEHKYLMKNEDVYARVALHLKQIQARGKKLLYFELKNTFLNTYIGTWVKNYE